MTIPNPNITQQYGFGGACYDDSMPPPFQSQSLYESAPSSAATPTSTENTPLSKVNWSRSRCIPRMVNVFIYLRESFLKRDEKLSREVIDAKDIDWFWRLAADKFNARDISEINDNMFTNDDAYPEELRSLDPYYRDGYSVTAAKLKTEFRNVRSILMKVHSNWKLSGQGDKEDDDDDHVFAANFIDFCRGDMPVYYLYCACAKFDLMKSTLVTMPADAQHDGTTKSRIYTPSQANEATVSRSQKRDQALVDALSKPVRIEGSLEGSKEIENINRIKRQKVESETYAKLHEEYIELFKSLDDESMIPFLRSLNRQRLSRIEGQLTELAKSSADTNDVQSAHQSDNSRNDLNSSLDVSNE